MQIKKLLLKLKKKNAGKMGRNLLVQVAKGEKVKFGVKGRR